MQVLVDLYLKLFPKVKEEEPEVLENGWIRSNFFQEKTEYFISSNVEYSPSRRFAMMKMQQRYHERKTKIIIYDVVERKLIGKIIKYDCTFIYWYWLDENTISLLTQHYKNNTFERFIYKLNFTKTRPRMELINKSVRAIHVNDAFDDLQLAGKTNVCRLKIQEHDFLLVNTGEYILLPYNLLSMGPHLPSLHLNFRDSFQQKVNGWYQATAEHVFTYKDTLYFWMSFRNSYESKRFLKVKVTAIDLTTRKALSNLNMTRADYFCPKQLNGGTYGTQSIDAGTTRIYQQEETVLLLYQPGDAKFKRKLWILDLEKETILEKDIKQIFFFKVTLYRNHLCLWKRADNQEIIMKYHWIGNKTPKLSDICLVKLMSQKIVDPYVSKVYNALLPSD